MPIRYIYHTKTFIESPPMESMTLIGLAAACFTTAAFVPQVVQILKTKNVEGISLGMYAIFTLGVALWLIYATIIGDLPMLLANLVTLILSGGVLTLTVRSRLCTGRTKTDNDGLALPR
jgi:MtN3 and saliva related transmembrane protein